MQYRTIFVFSTFKRRPSPIGSTLFRRNLPNILNHSLTIAWNSLEVHLDNVAGATEVPITPVLPSGFHSTPRDHST
jgi:hypothetical protein